MDISKYIKKSNSFNEVIPDKYFIEIDDWQKEIFENPRLVHFHNFANFERTAKYDNVSILKTAEGKKLARLDLIKGGIHIYYDKITPDLIVELNGIAESLDARLLINPQQEYPRHKIIAAQKRLSKKSKEPLVEYQKESFGGNNMWLAIRSNFEEVKAFYNLKGEEKPWAEALANMHTCNGMFIYEFKGWTFLAGQLVDTLFTEDGIKGEESIEKLHVDLLLEWGKTFSDIQLYMHYNRSMYVNAFYRVLNGEMVYGEYETESYRKKYGKLPMNLKDLPDNNANTVAIEWSYDPDYLRYQRELDNAQAWIVNINDKI